MGDDIIHSCLIAVQVANGSPNLVMGRLFLPPPIACIPALFIVLTVPATKGKIFLVLNGVNFPTLQVKNIRGNQSCNAAPPASLKDCLGVDVQQRLEIHAFFEDIIKECDYKKWFFGKCHMDRFIPMKFYAVFQDVLPVTDERD